MKVSELAERAGTTAKTIRFYETEGVLPPAPRRGNGYREYSDVDVCRTRAVVGLRSLGPALPESGGWAQLCAPGRCDERAGAPPPGVGARRADVAAAIAELQHL